MAKAEIPPDAKRYKTILTPVPTGSKQDWLFRIEFNGAPVEDIIKGPLDLTYMALWSEEHGAVFYGVGPEGYDRIIYREKGGVVTIPYAIIDGVLYIGFLKEYRSNANGTFMFALGSMVTVQKTCCAAMKKAAMEKANIDVSGAFELEGVRGLFNRLIQQADPLDNKGGGEKFYGLHVDSLDLEYSEEKGGYVLNSGCSLSEKKNAELIFLPWSKLVEESPDLIGLSALMRLMAHLDKNGVIEIKIK